MPEGDTVHRAANRIREVLAGRIPDEIVVPQARHARDHWPERLAGRAVEEVEAHGKHLFIHFEGGLLIHSHLRMRGSWVVAAPGSRARKSDRRIWLMLRTPDAEVTQFDGPVLELLTEARRRNDDRLTKLGPDVLGTEFDPGIVVRRLRDDDPTRPIGDALLDQRLVAGLGTIWRSEACFAARLDPWRVSAGVSDADVMAVLGSAREKMQLAVADGDGRPKLEVYGRGGRACRRCGSLVRGARLGDDARLVYWCPGCQG